jgi:hypothetical protein
MICSARPGCNWPAAPMQHALCLLKVSSWPCWWPSNAASASWNRASSLPGWRATMLRMYRMMVSPHPVKNHRGDA